MIINIFAGGPDEHIPELSGYQTEDSIWVGVDRGVSTLLKKGILPSMAFGDFDSVTPREMQVIQSQVKEVKTFKSEKDEPDMELALNWAIVQNPEKIRIFAGTGGRLDHFFANIQLLLRSVEQEIDIEVIDKQNIIFVRKAGTYHLEKILEKKYVSFIPVSGSVSGLTLSGFKYPLKDRHIPFHSTLCISNELINDFGTSSFTEGILLVIRSND